MKKALIYIRPWSKDFYVKIASDVYDNYGYLTISEFKGISDIWLDKGLYMNEFSYPLDVITINEIYLRCRFLRTLPIEKATLLIKKMYGYIEYIFDSYEIETCIGSLVDNYTLDILERICCNKNIRYISMVPHFFNGYTRFSSRGERFNYIREVNEHEIQNVLMEITDISYKPKFELNVEKTYFSALYYYYRERMKSIFFFLIKHITNDRYNYHYNSLMLKKSRKNYVSKEIKNLFIKLKDIDLLDSSSAVYLPLHFTPEATVDYWTDEPQDALYEDTILNIIFNSDDSIRFYVKEHPAMYMKRDRDFYCKLLKRKNTFLVHPYENSNELLENINFVFVTTGSVGVEALVRNKIVFTNTANYYSDIHPNIYLKKYISLEDLKIKLIDYDNKILIRRILETMFQGKFFNNWNIMDSDISLMTEEIQNIIYKRI